MELLRVFGEADRGREGREGGRRREGGRGVYTEGWEQVYRHGTCIGYLVISLQSQGQQCVTVEGAVHDSTVRPMQVKICGACPTL